MSAAAGSVVRTNAASWTHALRRFIHRASITRRPEHLALRHCQLRLVQICAKPSLQPMQGPASSCCSCKIRLRQVLKLHALEALRIPQRSAALRRCKDERAAATSAAPCMRCWRCTGRTGEVVGARILAAWAIAGRPVPLGVLGPGATTRTGARHAPLRELQVTPRRTSAPGSRIRGRKRRAPTLRARRPSRCQSRRAPPPPRRPLRARWRRGGDAQSLAALVARSR